MSSKIRIRAKIKRGITTVQAVLKHPMHTGNSRDPNSGEIIPAFFIEIVTVKLGEQTLMTCDWSRAISKNPYLSFSFSGANLNDTIHLNWTDSHGGTESETALIK